VPWAPSQRKFEAKKRDLRNKKGAAPHPQMALKQKKIDFGKKQGAVRGCRVHVGKVKCRDQDRAKRVRCAQHVQWKANFTQSISALFTSDVDARIKKAAKISGTLCDRAFSSRGAPERLMGKVYAGASLRCCYTPAYRGASRPRPSRFSASDTRSVFVKFVGSPCTKLFFTESPR
jgi:hypothetical protein